MNDAETVVLGVGSPLMGDDGLGVAVVDRLRDKGLLAASKDAQDSRRLLLAPTAEGRALFDQVQAEAVAITKDTLAPLNEKEQRQLLALLDRIS